MLEPQVQTIDQKRGMNPRAGQQGLSLVFVRILWLLSAILVVGNRIVSVPLAYVHFQTPCLDVVCTLEYARLSVPGYARLQALGIPAGLFAAWGIGVDIIFTSISLVIAAVIFWRKSEDRVALFVSFTLLLFGGFTFSNSNAVIASVWPAWRVPTTLLSMIGLSCFCIFLCVFPTGRFVPKWVGGVAVAFTVVNALSLLEPGLLIHGGINAVLFSIVAVTQVYRYRRVSNEKERQQTKWVVYGFIIGVGGYLCVGLVRAMLPWIANEPVAQLACNTAAYAFMLLVPLSIGGAILRARLYDIDILIRRTLIYGVLSALLGVIYLACLFVLQNLILRLTVQTSSTLILISSVSALAIGTLSRPLRARIQDFIDRRFYRRKYQATRVIAAFGASLRDELNLDHLTAKLLAVAGETMQPEHTFLGSVREAAGGTRDASDRAGMGTDMRVDMRADTDPSNLPALSPALFMPPGDALVAHFRTWPNTVRLNDMHLASPALEAMRAAKVAVATPLVSQGELVGVLNLGAHLSQQDYSQADCDLLDALAAQVAPALQVAKLVREQQAQEAQRARLDQELQLARQIQLSLLPKAVPVLDGWTLEADYQPARTVGGDFYDFIPLADGRLGIAIGDVTGKGMPAALYMATTRTMLRATAQTTLEPGEVLARVNALACQDIPTGMFVTCLYAVLDPATGRLCFANAGHDLPYYCQGLAATALKARGMPLGLMPGSAYEERTVTVSGGEHILFYTDGIVEAHNPQREMFGTSRLASLLATGLPRGGVNSLVRRQLMAFTGPDWDQEDDITLVTLRRE